MRRSTGILIAIVVIGTTLLGIAQSGVGGGGQSNVSGGSGIVNVTSAPSGSCTAGAPPQQVTSTGTIYTCQSGTWAAIGGSSAASVVLVPASTAANTIQPTSATVVPLTIIAQSASSVDQFDVCPNAGCTNPYFQVTSNGTVQLNGNYNKMFYGLNTNALQSYSGTPWTSGTAPSIASGFGTSPSISHNNGTGAFTVNVGSGGTASTGVITMPSTGGSGWNCKVTPDGAPQAAAVTYSAQTSQSSITLTNYTLTTGIALAWTASMVLDVTCTGD